MHPSTRLSLQSGRQGRAHHSRRLEQGLVATWHLRCLRTRPFAQVVWAVRGRGGPGSPLDAAASDGALACGPSQGTASDSGFLCYRREPWSLPLWEILGTRLTPSFPRSKALAQTNTLLAWRPRSGARRTCQGHRLEWRWPVRPAQGGSRRSRLHPRPAEHQNGGGGCWERSCQAEEAVVPAGSPLSPCSGSKVSWA